LGHLYWRSLGKTRVRWRPGIAHRRSDPLQRKLRSITGESIADPTPSADSPVDRAFTSGHGRRQRNHRKLSKYVVGGGVVSTSQTRRWRRPEQSGVRGVRGMAEASMVPVKSGNGKLRRAEPLGMLEEFEAEMERFWRRPWSGLWRAPFLRPFGAFAREPSPGRRGWTCTKRTTPLSSRLNCPV
jgi:hypothetical protein